MSIQVTHTHSLSPVLLLEPAFGSRSPLIPKSHRYILRSFGLKLDPLTDTYRMTLTIEQASGQERVEAFQAIPRPSQLDDWRLYERIEEAEIQRVGKDGFETWREMQKEEDRVAF